MNKIEKIGINAFLWILRFFGLTFGGIAIKANGKTYSNKFLVGFGLSLAVIITVYDLYKYVWNFSDHFQNVHQFDLLHNKSKTLRNSIIIHRVINSYNWLTFKTFILIYFNVKGYDLMDNLIDNYNRFCSRLITKAKFYFMIVFWFIQISIVSFMLITTNIDRPVTYVIWQLEYKLSFFYCWSICTTIALISIIYSERLTRMAQQIDDFGKSMKTCN